MHKRLAVYQFDRIGIVGKMVQGKQHSFAISYNKEKGLSYLLKLSSDRTNKWVMNLRKMKLYLHL